MRAVNIFLIILFATSACETTSNVDPRFDDYFIKYYGEEGNQTGVDVKKLEDGFIVLGNSTSVAGNTQIFLTKVDHLGNELWSGYFGGPLNDVAAAIAIDAAGNFIIAATVQNSGLDNDVMILKVSPDGVELNSKTYGTPGEDEVANSILVTQEGDYIVIGHTTNVDTFKKDFSALTDIEDIYSIRTTAELEQFEPADWRRIYGFSGVDRGVEIKQKNDGSFLFFGTTDRMTADPQKDGLNMFLFPAGPDGIALSSKSEPYGTLSNESGAQIVQTAGGGYVMIGTSRESGSAKPFMARVRQNIDYINSGTVGGTGFIEASSLAASRNGGFIILGKKTENNNSNIYIARLNNDGSMKWERTFGGVDSDDSGKIIELQDGSLVFVGTITLESQSKICLIKITEQGQLQE